MPSVRGTSIEGVLEFGLDVHEDDRGSFKENFQIEKLQGLGLPSGFRVLANNISVNKETGVTRGIHAEPWNKFISTGIGSVFAALVDLRPDSPTFQSVHTTEITPEKALFVPKGVGNSFQTLTRLSVYAYLVDGLWTPDAEYTFVNLDDPDLNIPWPISLGRAIISDKDRAHPRLAEIA